MESRQRSLSSSPMSQEERVAKQKRLIKDMFNALNQEIFKKTLIVQRGGDNQVIVAFIGCTLFKVSITVPDDDTMFDHPEFVNYEMMPIAYQATTLAAYTAFLAIAPMYKTEEYEQRGGVLRYYNPLPVFQELNRLHRMINE